MSENLYVNRLEVSNFMRVEAAIVDCHGNNVVIRGSNAVGKTTIIESIWECFATSSKIRPDPVHHGADKAIIRLDLQDDDGNIQYTIEKHFTPKSTRIVVTDAAGTKITRTKPLLESFLDDNSIDPIAFLDKRPQDQLDDVLQVAGIKPPVPQVNAITGEEFPARAGESADKYMERISGDEVGVFFVRRLEQGREVDKLDGAIKKQKEKIEQEQVKVPPGVRSVEEITSELDAARADKDAYEKGMRACAEKTVKAVMAKEKAQQRYESLSSNASNLLKRIEAMREELKKLETEFEEAREVATNAFADLQDAMQAVELLEKELPSHDSGALLLEKLSRVSELEAELKSSVIGQKQLAIVEEANRYLKRLQTEYQYAKKVHADLDMTLGDLRALRKAILDGIDIGVPGLAIDNGVLLLNGVNFIQASDAERITVAFAVATLRKPRLKLLRVDRGESLDSDSRKRLLQLAKDRGFQVIMACVSDKAPLSFSIEEKE